MKSAAAGVWKALGFTGKLIILLTVFYFSCMTFNK